MKSFSLILIAVLALTACKKKQEAPVHEYVKGDVLAGIKEDVPIDSAFTVINRLGLYIKVIYGFTYAVPYPENKLDSVRAVLKAKPYTDSTNWKAKISYQAKWNQNVYFSNFFNMDSTNQADWLATMRKMNFTDLAPNYKTVYLRVPEGSEQYWVDELSRQPIIRWAELNKITYKAE